jgi:hypothetical protein
MNMQGMSRKFLSGLSPKILYRNPANSATAGKGRKEKRHLEARAHGGFPEPQHNRKAPLARQVPSNYAVPDPMAFPVSKSLQAACPMHDT